MHRVVITGTGTINALGVNVLQTLEAMREGRCGIGSLNFSYMDDLSVKIGAQVRNFDAGYFMIGSRSSRSWLHVKRWQSLDLHFQKN